MEGSAFPEEQVPASAPAPQVAATSVPPTAASVSANSSPQGSPATNDGAAPPKASWEDDNDWGMPSQPQQAPPQEVPPPVAAPVQHQDPVAPPPAAESPEESENASPTEESAPPPPAAPEKDNSAAMEAINRQVANRVAAVDRETKEKEEKILAAAQTYLKDLATKREQYVSEAKASHKKEQQAGVQKIDELKKTGAVWTSVGMLVDLQKPNPHSKGTERMRALFNTLNEQKKA